jgi:hypothetical protein
MLVGVRHGLAGSEILLFLLKCLKIWNTISYHYATCKYKKIMFALYENNYLNIAPFFLVACSWANKQFINQIYHLNFSTILP